MATKKIKEANPKVEFKQTEIPGISMIFREAKKPEPKEKENQNGVVSWGEDNLFPQFLNGLIQDNPTHQGVINQKVKFITAGGLEVEGGNTEILENFGAEFDLQEIIESACHDLEAGESIFFHFKKNAEGQWSVSVLDYELMRVDKSGVFFHYSENWRSSTQKEGRHGYKKIKNILNIDPTIDTECVLRVYSKPKQRYFGEKRKELTANYYPNVGYSGAITDIMALIEMSYYGYAETVNGYKGGTGVNLANGVPATDELRREKVKEIKDGASNRDTQGGIWVTFSDGVERQPKVFQMNGNDLDKRYQQAKITARNSVLEAHGVISPALFSVFSESMFGSKEEMETAYLLFRENYVKFRQRQILSGLNYGFEVLNGFTGKIKFKDFTPEILKPKVDPVPIVQQKMSEQDVEKTILDSFSKIGVAKSSMVFLKSESFNGELSEEEFTKSFFTEKFALTTEEQVILTMIGKGETYQSILTAIGKDGVYLSKKLAQLNKNGLIDDWNLTEKGVKNTATPEQVKVLYSYELKPTAPPLQEGGTSRPFCTKLLEMDKLYTFNEINQISIAVDRDVWRFRGGWYHNPDTDKNTPSCRHEWQQHITINID